MNKNNLTIICTCDEEYIPFTKIFISSLAQNTKNINLHCRLINCPETAGDDLRHIFPNTYVQHDNRELCAKRKHLSKEGVLLHEQLLDSDSKTRKYRGARWLFSDKMAYCSNIKYNTINHLLNEGFKYLLYMDVDAIVRKDLSSLATIISENDITIRLDKIGNSIRPITEPGGVLYHCGQIGITNNIRTKMFFKEVEERTNTDLYDWDADQIEFYNVAKKMEREIDIFNMPVTYKDEGTLDVPKTFNSESHIWCGAASVKYSNKDYLDECERYE